MEGTPFGRYRLLELIGRGGMGEVWRAYDTATDRMVAVKVLPANLLDDQTFEQRFRREANAAAALNEPHVVPIHNFGEIEGRLYVDMRLIDGRDLQSLLSEGALEPARAVKVIEQVAAALNAAHRVGLVHRDVKPSNILVAEFDFAYLIDFGIARTVGETGLTNTGSMIGTWAYMAPERFSTGHTDPRSDTYALACVLHECLTGRQPYPGNSVEQQIAAHLTTPPPRPSITQSGVSPGFDAVVATGMAKEPQRRYPTTLEMARAARSAITTPVSGPIPGYRPEPPTRLATPNQRTINRPPGAPPPTSWPTCSRHPRRRRPTRPQYAGSPTCLNTWRPTPPFALAPQDRDFRGRRRCCSGWSSYLRDHPTGASADRHTRGLASYHLNAAAADQGGARRGIAQHRRTQRNRRIHSDDDHQRPAGNDRPLWRRVRPRLPGRDLRCRETGLRRLRMDRHA